MSKSNSEYQFIVLNPHDISEEKARKIYWIANYLVSENFPLEHLTALEHITGLFNDCKESEIEIFEFSKALYEKYAG